MLEEMVVESREDHATEDGFAFQVKRSKTIVKAKKIKKESKRASSRASSRTRRVEVEKEIEKEDAEPETPPQPRRKATIIGETQPLTTNVEFALIHDIFDHRKGRWKEKVSGSSLPQN